MRRGRGDGEIARKLGFHCHKKWHPDDRRRTNLALSMKENFLAGKETDAALGRDL